MEFPGKVSIGSDIHYASAMEQSRGRAYEIRAINSPMLRLFVRLYRRFFWDRNPLAHNHLLDAFLARAEGEAAIICGDLTCDTGFVGVSDDAAFSSASECVGKLRARFGQNLRVVYGDHDLGKLTMFGMQGGMRVESLRRLRDSLGLPPFWIERHKGRVLMGLSSTLLALPEFEREFLPEEKEDWYAFRREHLAAISAAFEGLASNERVLLFLHDPTALPFLLELKPVAGRISQIERTFVGHLHSNLIMMKSRLLAGMPHVRFLGHTVSKLSGALRRARDWRAFHVTLCPALRGIELLKDGGYYETEFPAATSWANVEFRWKSLKPVRSK